MSAPSEPLPSFRASCKLGGPRGTAKAIEATFWAAAFYPFHQNDDPDPVFTVSGGNYTIVCRALPGKGDDAVEELLRFYDEDKNACLNSLAWAKEAPSGDPLLCVTGALPTIKIFNIEERGLVKTLTGHGAPINDLAVPKTNPTLLASASEDHTVRIWSLNALNGPQPCVAIFAGAGHRAGLQTIDFHLSGKYLLSGGQDTFINLVDIISEHQHTTVCHIADKDKWSVPDLTKATTSASSWNTSPEQIHYPHFSTAEVHSDKIDTIKFHTDLILSSAATSPTILLWRIKGFSPSSLPSPSTSSKPSPLPARPTSTPETWSAFGSGWELLLTFSVPDTSELWFRFGLFSAPGRSSVLAAGNAKGKVRFWDFGMLENGVVGDQGLRKDGRRGRKKKGEKKNKEKEAVEKAKGDRGGGGEAAMTKKTTKQRPDSAPTSREASPVPGRGTGAADLQNQECVSTIGGPMREQPPHKIVVLPEPKFYGLQAAWSMCGRWCVLAGQGGRVMVLDRQSTKERDLPGG